MAYKVSDNAATTLAAPITSSPTVTSIILIDAANFPVINHGGSGSDYTFVTLYDAANNIETVRVTRRDSGSNTLTIVRGTAAAITGVNDASCLAWSGTTTGVACRLVAMTVNEIATNNGLIVDHLADAVDAHDASSISFSPTGTVAATTVQAAIAELDAEKQPASANLDEFAAVNPTAAGLALLDDADAVAQRVTLGLGSASILDVGTTANKIVQLDTDGKLPSIDASKLTQIGVNANSQTASYTLVLSDNGKSIDFNGSAGQTITIPANASVAFPVGSTVTITNTTANSLSISITTDTMRHAGTTNIGTRTLANYGVATARKVGSTTWIISGAGLS